MHLGRVLMFSLDPLFLSKHQELHKIDANCPTSHLMSLVKWTTQDAHIRLTECSFMSELFGQTG